MSSTAALGMLLLDLGLVTAAEPESPVVRITEPPRQYRSGPSAQGNVSVTFEPSMTRLKTEICPSYRLSIGFLLGCVNIDTGGGCAITLWSGLKRAPALRNAVEAHERAHCRGWGADHAGGVDRTYHVGRGFFAGAKE